MNANALARDCPTDPQEEELTPGAHARSPRFSALPLHGPLQGRHAVYVRSVINPQFRKGLCTPSLQVGNSWLRWEDLHYGLPTRDAPPVLGLAAKSRQRATLHTGQVLQLEEPVPERESWARAPDRHRSHPSKSTSALDSLTRRGAPSSPGAGRTPTFRILPEVNAKPQAARDPVTESPALFIHCLPSQGRGARPYAILEHTGQTPASQ